MLLIKGSEVVLREHGSVGRLDDIALRLPPDYVLCHDPTGEYLPQCHFYICRFKSAMLPEDRTNADTERLAKRFYGNATKIVEGDIDLPDGDWHRVCLIDEIGYRRRGDRGGLYQHNYAESVPLYECKGKTRAWRLQLPVSCIADERGFVSP